MLLIGTIVRAANWNSIHKGARLVKFVRYISVFFIVTMLSCTNSFAYDNDLNIGGFISQGYLKTNKNNYLADTEDGSFQFNELGLFFSTSPVKRLTISCQFFAYDIGDVGNDKIGFNYFFAQYKQTEWFGVGAGRVKIDHGLYSEIRDFDVLRTFIFLPQGVYNEWFRDGSSKMEGIEFFGNINIGHWGTISYRSTHGSTNLAKDSGTSKFYQEVSNLVKDVTEMRHKYVTTNSLTWLLPYFGLKFKAYFAYNDYAHFTGNEQIYDSGVEIIATAKDITWTIFSIESMVRGFVFAAEYYLNNAETNVLLKSDPSVILPGGSTIKSEGFYCSVAYQLLDNLQVGGYYSSYENDKDSSGPENQLKEIVFSLRLDINLNWTTKFECHKMDGYFGVTPDNGSTLDDDWYFYAAKVSYNF